MNAVPPAPAGLLAEGGAPVTFTFDGRPVAAIEGQSIAAALYAAGVRVFSRSFKYHRPRGLFCVSGDCPNCLMHVDGRPNVRTCLEPVRVGMVVRHQNAWPSLGFDCLRILDRLGWLLPAGFVHKHLYRPRWLWPVWRFLLRRGAGLGRIDVDEVPDSEGQVAHLHPDVCVIGGGPAGLAAARAAADAGVSVLLLERLPRLGGHLLYERDQQGALAPLVAAVREAPGLAVRTGATAFGLYEGNLVAAVQGNTLLKVRAGHVLVCTGGRPQPFVFANNDLPGIFLGRGVQRLARLYGVVAGRRAVVYTDHDGGRRLAADLSELGIEVVAVVDRRPAGDAEAGSWRTLPSSAVVRARGGKRLKAVVVQGPGERGGATQEIPCDLLCIVSDLAPADELARPAGIPSQGEAGPVLSVSAAGAAAGCLDLAAQVEQGRHAGAAAAARAGGEGARAAPAPRAVTIPPEPGAGGKAFVCLCQDVTAGDLQRAVAEGFEHVEMLRRYAAVGLGPCQGRTCTRTAAAVCARATGGTAAAPATLPSRPPAVPVELAVLAAGQGQRPVRRTPLHHWHHAAGAKWTNAGRWKRPENYGDPASEVRAVREAVGLLDDSTRGKFEVLGPDAVAFLERVYLNRWSDLPEARLCRAALCHEDGTLLDEGVAVRLAPDRFYLTATTEKAEAVYQGLLRWKAAWRLDVTVLDHTASFAALNLTGPRARETLVRMTEMDLSPTAFPHGAFRHGRVAGTPCWILRAGLLGEVGYEIHCPSAYAWYLWSALYEAGAEYGLRLFGVEAERVLRLEVGRPLIGHDTDARSDPFGAGLEALVCFDKPTFLGRGPLARLKARGVPSRLIGFHMADTDRVPPEGSLVVDESRPVGRVTSARFSPTLQKGIGLAWVPAATAEPGQRFLVRCNDQDVPAVVAATPFYDPDGTRQKG
jgi:sarcosine oxidase subunit alpha